MARGRHHASAPGRLARFHASPLTRDARARLADATDAFETAREAHATLQTYLAEIDRPGCIVELLRVVRDRAHVVLRAELKVDRLLEQIDADQRRLWQRTEALAWLVAKEIVNCNQGAGSTDTVPVGDVVWHRARQPYVKWHLPDVATPPVNPWKRASAALMQDADAALPDLTDPMGGW